MENLGVCSICLHGGPGGAGEMASIARTISEKRGTIEALQTKKSISGQLTELNEGINAIGNLTVVRSDTPGEPGLHGCMPQHFTKKLKNLYWFHRQHFMESII